MIAIFYSMRAGAVGKIMNGATGLKSVVASAVTHLKIRGPMGARAVTWCASLACASLPALAFAQSPCPGIHVNILNIKNSTGTVACSLFESPDGFPHEYLRSATNVMVIKIRKAQARCDFEDIPPGNYAMAVVHDENMNGKLDTNLLGIPTEGYGFSNDPKGFIGPPSFSAASFSYNGENIDLTMSLHY